MVKKIQHKHVFMVPRQFSMVIFTDDNASIFFAGGRWQILYHTSFGHVYVLPLAWIFQHRQIRDVITTGIDVWAQNAQRRGGGPYIRRDAD